MSGEKRYRALIAKPGLDGHDRGAKVIVYALRDAGMEVIYTGLHSVVEEIVEIAIQEDVDVIGLSILSGAHLSIVEKLHKHMQEKSVSDVPVVLGGVVPEKDMPRLKELGIKGIFTSGTSMKEITEFVRNSARERQRTRGD